MVARVRAATGAEPAGSLVWWAIGGGVLALGAAVVVVRSLRS